MDKLDQYFIEYNKIDQNTKYDIYYLEPEKLINHRRIDIIVKYYYIKARETGENMELAKDLYIKHIEAFSDGTFAEQGNDNKDSIDKYLQVFNDMIESFKEKGFDEALSIIPIGKNEEILDGSHRAACALYFKEKVKVIRFPDLSVDYGFEFFRRRLLDEFYLDFIAKLYINLDRRVYAMFVWPSIGTNENAKYIEESMKQEDLDIIYKKQVKLDKQELWNVIFNTYKDEHWISSPINKFKAIDENRDRNYNEDGYLYVYILKNLNSDILKKKKESLRKHFGLGNYSIHTFDESEESVDMLNILLDKDSDKILYENYLNTKDKNYTFKRYMYRKMRHIYRKTINQIKAILGRPV